MSRGIGDPLVALYARCYLCRIGVLVAPDVSSHFMINFQDFMATYTQVCGGVVVVVVCVMGDRVSVHGLWSSSLCIGDHAAPSNSICSTLCIWTLQV